MSIAKVQDVGTYQLSSGSGTSSHTSTALANAIGAGNFVAVWCAINGLATQNTLTDSLGNTYTKILQVTNVANLALWVCYSVTTGGTPTYTLACSAVFQYWALSASEWSGVGSPVDVTASATGTTSTSLSTGTTAATAAANALVLAGFGVSDTVATDTTTTPAGYSVLGAVHTTSGVYYVFPFSVIVSSTGTQSASSTLSAAPSDSFNLIAAFPAAAAADPFPAGYQHPQANVCTG